MAIADDGNPVSGRRQEEQLDLLAEAKKIQEAVNR